MNTKLRIILSTVGVTGWALINTLLNKVSPVISGETATKQLENTDTGFFVSQAGSFFNGAGISLAILLVALLVIWWKPLRGLFAFCLVASLLGIGLSSNCWAYYDRQDFPEFVEIMPNQSAFLIPEVGANKTSQAAFMSQEYLTENKVAMKRVQIPHTQLKNPGWNADYYIPSARLIIVDRTPYMREWVASSTRGTSTKNEAFYFETADSVNVSTGIAISAHVTEEDSAKFLYWFGTKPTEGNQSDPSVQFASTVYGRSLEEIMDTVVRGKVQSVLAREFGSRSTEDCIHQKKEIITIVEKEVSALCTTQGITIDYIGYADSLSFDDKIQEAINKVFIAEKDAQAAEALNKMMPIYQQQADIQVKKATAEAITHWDGRANLPSFMIIPSGLLDTITGWFKPSAQTGATTDKK